MLGAVPVVDGLQGRPSRIGEFSHRGEFEIVKELHHSSAGSVQLARVSQERCSIHGQRVILKCRRVPELGKAKDMLNEYELLKQLDHPNIISCHGYFWDFQSQSLCIVLEFADRGDLHMEVQSRHQLGQHFSNDEVWDIYAQALMGLAHVHSKGIVHRDVKSLNIFLTSRGLVKLGDFGVSRQMSDHTMYLNSFYGTPLYLSPELIQGRPYSETTDVWSLGVVLYELLALQPPFHGKCLQEVISAVLRGRYAPLPVFRQPELVALVSSLLTREAHKRPKTTDLLQRLEEQGRLRSLPQPSSAPGDVAPVAGQGCNMAANPTTCANNGPAPAAGKRAMPPQHVPSGLGCDA